MNKLPLNRMINVADGNEYHVLWVEADLPINWDLHDPLLERIKSNEFDGIKRHVMFVYQQMGSYLS